MNIALRFIQLSYKTLSVISPRLAGNMALNMFQKPQFKKCRTRELAIYEDFEEKRIPNDKEALYVYEKGDPLAYPVILVHGWDSNPGSMYGIAKQLVENNFRVIVVGIPAHGRSKLKKTNMFESARSIQKLLTFYNLNSHFSMVTHSFGSGASAIALGKANSKIDQLIFLTSPDILQEIFDEFAKMIHLGKKAYAHLLKKTEKILGLKMKAFVISDMVRLVHFKKLTIIHDKEDKILPYQNALNFKKKIPKTNLIAVDKLGHYRLLWDQKVIDIITELLKSNFK